jgi:hypothetical protein
MKVLVSIAFLLLVSCSNKMEDLEDNVRTLNLQFIAWGYNANWVIDTDLDQFFDNHDSLTAKAIFVEPAELKMTIPDTLGYGGDIVKFTGQFYKQMGYPKGTSEQEQKKGEARVFRYTKYEVLKSTYRDHRSGRKIAD